MNHPLSNLFVFQAPALDGARVVSIRGREAVSEPYRFEIGLAAAVELDGAGVVGERATLAASLDDGGPDYRWHGVVAALDLLHAHSQGAGDAQFLYRAILVPRLWRLGLSLHSRVFVGDSTPDILLKILAMNGLAGDVELKLEGDYPPQPHVCQYKESDLAFISRWMEREGLYYFFDHEGAGDKLIITDASAYHDSLRKDPIRYDPRALEDASAGEALHALSSRRSALPRAIELRDYDHLKPALDVFGDQGIGQGLDVAQRHFGDNFTTPDEAKRLATVRSQELACRGVVYRGTGHILRLRSGYRFEVDGHPCQSFNAPMLCTELEHHANLGVTDPVVRQLLEVGHDEIYRVELQAIPADTQFRAERKTPKPRIYGVERATIDGPTDSKYAQLDEHGRYKVKIHFDESDLSAGNASTWIRMLQPHGGETEGFHFPLRKGTEVMLTFLGGDPDQPVIAGAAPNAHKVSPVVEDNQTWNVINTGGKNKIRFNDEEGKEYIELVTPYDTSILAMGHPTILKNFGHPPRTVEASAFLGTQGTGAFYFGQNWEIEVGANKNEFVIGSESVRIGVSRDETVVGTCWEEYGTHFNRVREQMTEVIMGPVQLEHQAGESIAVTGDRLHTVSGASTLAWGSANLLFGETGLMWGATSGRIESLDLKVPGGVTIVTPSYKILHPQSNEVTVSLNSTNGKYEHLTVYKSSTNAIKIDMSGLVFSSYGVKLDNRGYCKKTDGIEIKCNGPSIAAKAVRVLTAGLVNLS